MEGDLMVVGLTTQLTGRQCAYESLSQERKTCKRASTREPVVL